jgi:hypothetical protein
MGIWFRMILLSFLAFGLTGCNLETKKPLFADADAKLLLADYPNLATYERDDGGWKKSDDFLSFTPEVSHYLVKSGKSDMQVFFVPVEGPWWILQGTESAGPTSYVLIKAEPKELLVYSLDCKSLKDAGKYENDIDFVDSDCFVKADTDAMALFKSLIAAAKEPSTKLVSEP